MVRLQALAKAAVLLSSVSSTLAAAQCTPATPDKPRVFLLSDIANEPDDAQSLVRLLVYSNELRVEGLVATTSIWLNDTTRPDQMHDIVDAYEEVRPNLLKHATGYPEAGYLRDLITSGLPVYGMYGVGEGKDSEGSKRLVKAVDASDEPLWVPVWGGASVLAQALWHVNATRSPAEIEKFVSKLRAYSISDQDNTGSWIRRNFPQLFFIASIHHFNRYALAAWGGISGDQYYNFPSLASRDVVSADWIKENIQRVSPLGAKYPDTDFIVEGDTPSLLYLIPNGLSDPEHPEWGSWGGRYGPVTYGEGHFADSVDVIKDSGKTIMSSQATVWRWREAFQNDFAARMKWTGSSGFDGAPHAPVVVLNGDKSRKVVKMVVKEDQEIGLDARESCDPDGGDLTYKWWQYLEPSSNNNSPGRDVGKLELSDTNSAIITVTMPSKEVLRAEGRNRHPEEDKHLHLILEVSDGTLVSYRRVIFTIPAPKAGEATSSGEKAAEKAGAHDEL
ncbi:cellulose-binding protein [Colletotrichum karsti]|uniref:Cellulose-binding protein n=1 Tax=Colletotrichum karsti TaxID=1095194 RepID=A0A9P6I848_9PEZI|nr:cellulose-binding protein [Colletotrichum karsti]KAF9877492.1 cellulose-binding protein [Colletotrichum karsti]